MRRTIQGMLVSGTALGALVTCSMAAVGADSVDAAWRSASPVQAYGVAPANRMPAQGAGIQLMNDPGTGGEVFFLLDGQEQSLKPGETMDLSADRPHLVEFNTGGNFGDVKFSLYQGVYKFKVMPEGWALFKSSSQPSSVTGRPGAASPTPATGTRSFTPPLPAEDLRTRRIAGAAATGRNPQGTVAPRAVNPPQPPSAAIGAGQETTNSNAAPPAPPAPPAPGVTRERSAAPKAP